MSQDSSGGYLRKQAERIRTDYLEFILRTFLREKMLGRPCPEEYVTEIIAELKRRGKTP